MRNNKKIMLSILLMTLTLLTGTIPVYAQEWTQEITVSTGFTSKWEKSKTLSFDTGETGEHFAYLTYGYDTWWVNEDYVNDVGGNAQGLVCKGRVTNSEGKGRETGDIPSGFRSGKADIEHTGPAKYAVIIWFN